MSTDWIDRETALHRLGVRSQTLYAYVSRGRVEARPDPADPRRSLYRAADIGALTERRARGRKASAVAQSAISWGEPVLASAITTIAGGRLWYRGRDAAQLAETQTLESVARLLRGGHGAVLKAQQRETPPDLPDGRARLFAALAARAAVEPPARGRAPLALALEGASLLDRVADAVSGGLGPGPIHQRLAEAWGKPTAADDLRRALVLLADHELNASTFAARVAASTGRACPPPPWPVFAPCRDRCTAAWRPVSGTWLRSLAASARPPRSRVAWPAPRPRPDSATRSIPRGTPGPPPWLAACPPTDDLAALLAAVEAGTGERANIDFALVAMAERLGLPKDAPFLLFAVARSAGWIAHAVEEGSGGRLIRPRARYVGPAVGG